MIANALEGKQLPVYGDGMQMRDWLYVSDHAGAIEHILDHGVAGEIYNIPGEAQLPNREVVAGLLERLVEDFPRYKDESDYHGHRVQLYKLAQLALWGLHATRVRLGLEGIRDLDRMSAFADYIVPVALRVMGIFEYEPSLERRINEGVEIPRDSDEEIEIRAQTLYATALLTDAVNAHRPAHLQLVIPQVDYRLWKAYHASHHPHHLTRTVMY